MHVSSLFYSFVAFVCIPAGCVLLLWMSLVCWCGVNRWLLLPVQGINSCSASPAPRRLSLPGTEVQCGPVRLNFAGFVVLFALVFLALETFVMISHASKASDSKNDYKLRSSRRRPALRRIGRLMLLGVKWRSERNFYMALLNCVLWLCINFQGSFLDQLLEQQAGQSAEQASPDMAETELKLTQPKVSASLGRSYGSIDSSSGSAEAVLQEPATSAELPRLVTPSAELEF